MCVQPTTMIQLGRCIDDSSRHLHQTVGDHLIVQRWLGSQGFWQLPQPICGALRKFLMITEVDARRQGLDGTAGKHPFVLGGARRKTRDVVPICIEKTGGTVPIMVIYIYVYVYIYMPWFPITMIWNSPWYTHGLYHARPWVCYGTPPGELSAPTARLAGLNRLEFGGQEQPPKR